MRARVSGWIRCVGKCSSELWLINSRDGVIGCRHERDKRRGKMKTRAKEVVLRVALVLIKAGQFMAATGPKREAARRIHKRMERKGH